ncbi:MAG: hypothetical protein ACYCXK_03175 [Candidatus Humimicrobiaceae bacterium]
MEGVGTIKGSKKNILKRIDIKAAKIMTIAYDKNSLPKLLLGFVSEEWLPMDKI